MSEKKICVVTTISGTLKGFLIDQLVYLSKHGYKVTVVCNKDDEFKEKLPKELTYKPITMKRGMDSIGAFKSIYSLYKIFKDGEYDIVQYSTPNASFYSSIASYMAKIPNRLYSQWGIRYVGFEGTKRFIFKSIEKTTCNLSTIVEPDSYGNLEFSWTEGLYDEYKSRVIWNGSSNGINLGNFDVFKKALWREKIRNFYDISDDDFVFGFVGRLNRDKGVNELLISFKQINQKHNNVKLMIVGWQNQSKEVKKELLEWSKNEKNVIYCGPQRNVQEFYSAMDAFIFPSYREGLPNVLLEAQAMGVPVIVSDIPGNRDAINNGVTGYLFPKKEIVPIVNLMETMINERNTIKMIGYNGVQFVKSNFEQSELWKYILEDRNKLVKKIS